MIRPCLIILISLLAAAGGSHAGVVAVRANLPEPAAAATLAEAASRAAMPAHAPRHTVSRAPAAEPVTSTAKYDTLGHRILAAESALGSVTPAMYALLDQLIDEARSVIGPVRISDDPAQRQAEALKALRAIDDLLTVRSFVYPGCAKGLVQLLSDGLTPTTMDDKGLEALLCQPHNERRREHIERHRADPFYVTDCDTASVVYLAIGEALGLPLAMVEVPEHNFVRWYFSDGTYLNWETMDGEQVSDDDYRLGWGVPKPLEEAGVFLSRMSPQDVFGYWSFVVGLGWERQRRCEDAITSYQHATRDYGRSPSGWNNLAWILATCRDAAHRDGKAAVNYALKAVTIYRSANILDTLACAYAEAGDFEKAIETESEAYRLSGDPRYAKTIEGFRRGLTWIEQHPDEPTPAALLALQANR